MDQWKRNAELFEPKGTYDKAWKPIYQAMHKSANKMNQEWIKDWDTGAKLCAEPNKGDDHAEHKKLEDELYDTLKKELYDEVTAWREDAKTLYRYDCDSMKQLQKNYCEDLDGDGEEEDQEKTFDTQADEMKVEMENKVHAAWTQLAGFRSRAGRLEARRNGRMATIDLYAAWRDELRAFSATVAVEEQAITDVFNNGIARGARNPKIQLWITFGKQRHHVMEDESKYACTLKDQTYADKKRPDCLSVTQCKIWEFKPPGDKAKKRGESQVNGYKTLLEEHYNAALDLFRQDKPSDPVGGMSVLKELDRACAKGGALVLEKEVAQYERCGPDSDYICAPQAK
jgi:hypothetical protein